MQGGYTTSGKPLQSNLGRQQQEYYVAKSRANDTAKDALIAGLADGAAVVTRSNAVDAILEEALGGLETPGSLNAAVTGTLTRTGYKVDKVRFESLPNWTVTGNFYFPDASVGTPAPGVLVLCGHDTDGKVGYQSIAQGLAKSGYCALIIDAVGMAERKQIPSNSPNEEHREIGKNMPLVGASMPALQARDAMAAIDYLVSRAEVDDTQIGVCGTSGGGTQTMLVAALDDRITMIAVSCAVTTHTANHENELYLDHEQVLLDGQGAGLDEDDWMLRVLANGGAVCIVKQGGAAAVSGDYYDTDGTDEIHARLVEYATLLGVDPDDYARLVTDTNGHQLDDDGKRGILRFFNTHTGGDVNANWPSITPETEPNLRVTPTGNVVDLVGERNSVAMITDLSDACAVTRGTPTGATLKLRLREVLRMPDYLDNGGDLTDETLRASPPHYRVSPFEATWSYYGEGSVPAIGGPPNYPRGYGARYLVETEAGIICPLYMLTSSPWVSRLPTVTAGTAAFLYVAHLSADQELSTAGREALITSTIAANPTTAFFAVDLRGTGESQPNINSLYAVRTSSSAASDDSSSTDDDYFGRHADSFNEPLLGRRTWDLLRVIDLLASRGYTDIRLIGRGWGANATSHAALLDSRVTAITLKNALTRWTAVAHASPGEIVWGMGDLPRRVLNYYDLPDVYADLAANKGLASAFNAGHGQTEYGTSPWGAWGANAAGEF